jgi:hypothetical protein
MGIQEQVKLIRADRGLAAFNSAEIVSRPAQSSRDLPAGVARLMPEAPQFMAKAAPVDDGFFH